MNGLCCEIFSAKGTQDAKVKEEYEKMRNRDSKELKIAETKYWKKNPDTEKGGSDFWKIVREQTGKEGSEKEKIGLIKSEIGDILTDDKQIDEWLKKFFEK